MTAAWISVVLMTLGAGMTIEVARAGARKKVRKRRKGAIVKRTSRLVRFAVCAGVALGMIVSSSVAGVMGQYDLSKSLQLTDLQNGAMVKSATWRDFEHAWVEDGPAAAQKAFDVSPKAQPAGFGNFSTEKINQTIMKINGMDRVVDYPIVQPGVPKDLPVNLNVTTPLAFPSSATSTAMSTIPLTGSTAKAEASYELGKIAKDGSVSAKTAVKGNYNAVSDAYAFSYSRIDISGNAAMAKAQATVTPIIGKVVVLSNDSGTFGKLPVFYNVLDPSGKLVSGGTLLDISYQMTGPSSLSWNNGMFSIQALNADFTVSIDGSLVSGPSGLTELTIQNGVFTKAVDPLGVFASLPMLDSAGNFSTSALSQFVLNYNLGTYSSDDTVNLDFDSGAGLTAVPEPASFLLLASPVLAGLAYSGWRRYSRKQTVR
jgi:hypothetical protein